MILRMTSFLLLAACILLVTLMLSVDSNFRAYVDDLRAEQTVAVYLHPTAAPLQLESLIREIRSLPGFHEFRIEDQQAAFDKMQSLLGRELLPDSSANPLPSRIVVSFEARFATLDRFQKLAPQIQRSSAVDTVTFNAAWIAAQEQAFDRWQLIILATLGLSLLATIFALVMSVTLAEQSHRAILVALQMHGAGLALIVRRFVGRWLLAAALAVGIGIGAAYLIWYLTKSQFASSVFVEPKSLVILASASTLFFLIGLLSRSLRYR